ncbi:hypothetical protein SAMN05216190_12814 [Pseudomonas borbori]|uniref:Uncharacterized protein n=1 Tax=Pseudomonas borbori TaxID=289003 RepID=A0A1I5UZD3_9PSED|nr:hypothetical protein SAMN05216190_12814 [Pseudomonas borbori]
MIAFPANSLFNRLSTLEPGQRDGGQSMSAFLPHYVRQPVQPTFNPEPRYGRRSGPCPRISRPWAAPTHAIRNWGIAKEMEGRP